MKLSIALPNCMHVAAVTQPWEHDLTGADILTVAKLADELGFTTAFIPEHFLTPTEHVPLSGDHYFHATTALGVVAGATSRIRVGAMLSILPLHHPVIAAKAWATLDWLSGGRAVPCVGVGWLPPEFEIVGVPFAERGKIMDEYVAAMVELWTNESPSFKGTYVSFDDVKFAPRPLQKPHLPLWFGGDSDAALRRIGRFGDGWAPWQTPPEALPARLDFIKSQPGYDGRPFDVFFSLAALNIGAEHVIKDDPRAGATQDAGKVVDQCGQLADAGVTETWVAPPPLRGLDEYLDHMRWVAAEVMPKVS